METIGNRLKILRKALNLNQGKFAQGIGLKQGSYSEIENEKEILTSKNIEFICLKYNVNIDWLKNGKGQIFINQKITSIERELLEIYEKLIPKNQKDVLDYAIEKLELQKFREKSNKNHPETTTLIPPTQETPGKSMDKGKGANPIHDQERA